MFTLHRMNSRGFSIVCTTTGGLRLFLHINDSNAYLRTLPALVQSQSLATFNKVVFTRFSNRYTCFFLSTAARCYIQLGIGHRDVLLLLVYTYVHTKQPSTPRCFCFDANKANGEKKCNVCKCFSCLGWCSRIHVPMPFQRTLSIRRYWGQTAMIGWSLNAMS